MHVRALFRLAASISSVAVAACGDQAVPLPQAPPAEPPADAGLDSGIPDSGGPGEDACPPPPADLPELEVEANGDLLQVHDFPLEGFQSRVVTIYLPAGYDDSLRYPVVYFTDGQWVFGGGYRTHLAMEALVEQGLVQPHIIVAVSNSPERTRELTPDEDPDDIEVNGDGDAFAARIVDRVKPFVDSHFATRCGRKNTTIAGFSLGGLMCLHMVMRDPDIFGRGICVSPSFWWNGRSILDRFAAYDGALPAKLWIDVGTREAPTPQLVEAYPEIDLWDHPMAIRAGRDVAIDKGMILGEDLGYYEAFDALHTQMDVRARMPTLLAFTLSDATLGERAPTGHGFHVWHEEILTSPAPANLLETTVSFELRYDEPFVLTLPNTGVQLSSQDEAVATIDAGGIIQSVAPGTATLDASAMGFDASGTIEVVAPPE